jgi:DNA-binding beta-propeller fold protein YncE
MLLAVDGSATQAAPFAYVTNEQDDEVTQYNVGAGGVLSPLSPFTVDAAGKLPDNEAISPDWKSVYVGNTGLLADDPDDEPGSIAQFDVDPDGTLSAKNPAKVRSCGSTAHQVAVSPNGGSVYVATGADCNRVFQYDVAADGTLSPKSPAFLYVDGFYGQPVGVAVSPDSQSVYVTDYSCESRVYQYDVDAAGRLVPKSPAWVPAGGFAFGIAVAPDGQNVYVVNEAACGTDNHGGVSQYDVGVGGRLIPKSPPLVAAGRLPRHLAVSPDNRSLYVANRNDHPANGSVSQYDIDSGTGALSAKSPARVAAGGGGAEDIAVNPDSQSVYVANGGFPGNGSISQYDVGIDGALSAKDSRKAPAGDSTSGIAARPLVGGPTTKQQCRDGGWRGFAFKNQRQCIRFVKNRAGKSCRIERVQIGRSAFRERYGNPKHHQRRAFRRCVRHAIDAP